ncbi:subtilase family protein [Lysobacter antibioticus]|uniref:S8 family serine peptidase n=2 Tax=Lysobacter antibioticus TaxID=84531 RepID=UPI000717022E|nr:S8 family serine peptidase [Lysobacter antibioticus]ALN65495.1 subtilase family protein [Lysobacter antibioticus]
MIDLRASWFIGCILLLLCNDCLAETRRRAVLVGVNNYQASSVTDLNGTRNDVHLIRTLLVNRYGFAPTDITILFDGQATHDGILRAIKEDLAQKSDSDDVAVFYFSGHGSQMPDVSNDETDRWDETLVAVDSRMPDVYDISDDELNAAFSAVATRTKYITIILDSCHSGNAARATNKVRRIARDERLPPGLGTIAPAGARSTDGADDILGLGEGYVLISGSRSEELSNEDMFDDRIQGALTYHLAQVAQTDPNGTYRSVFPKVIDRVHTQFPSQTPQLEGAGMDSLLFDTASGSNGAWIIVNPEGGARASVQAGTLYGIRPGAVLSVFPPGSGPLVSPIATVKIDTVEIDAASGTLVGAATIPPYSRARMDSVSFDGKARAVWVSPQIESGLRSAIGRLVADYSSLRLLDASPASLAAADFRIYLVDGIYEVVARDGVALTATVPVGDVNAAERLVNQLHDWTRWLSLQLLRNPYSNLRIELDVRPADSAPGTPTPVAIQSGTPLDVEIRNLSTEPLYFALLDLSSTGQIDLVYPAVGAQDQIPAGRRVIRTFRMRAPADRPWVGDTFKAITSTTPIDGRIFRQGAIRDVVPQTESPFSQMVRARATAMARQADLVEMKDWTTAERSVRINNSGPRFGEVAAPAIALHFATPALASNAEASLNGGRRAVCPASVPCATARPLSADGLVVEVSASTLTAKRRIRNAEPADSIGQAFDDAYRAGDAAGATYAEPLITLTTVDAPDDTGIRGGDSPPDPISLADERWSLKYADVPAAWRAIRDSGVAAAGAEASGIFIGHPDTGYTLNPENWTGSTPIPIDDTHDHDYVDNDDDALDPLLEQGLLKNPGHGTGSGSVIVSPDGCQLSGKTQCVSGIAPGARLMPLRVHKSVVVFDTSALSRAIEDAATGRWGQKADVISIAMGGPPSRTLHKAVRNATNNGVVVVAAAGNYVRTVVWPARFSESIAVSAINPQCTPWTHASRGRAIDFSAPGEGVWRATTKAPADYDAGMGAGTTFATGTTAGIAALWLSRHRAHPAMASLKASGNTANVFRDLVQKTSWRPNDASNPPPTGVACPTGASWNSRKYGTGVIDAGALLAKALPVGAAQSRGPVSSVELFATLYPDGTASNRIDADYFAIFPARARENAGRFETEVMFHYTNSEEVQVALDEFVAGNDPDRRAGEVRAALLAQDLSNLLRTALQSGGPQ